MKTALIKQLREDTFASYLDCANALKAHDGDYDAALEQLRANNMNKAVKKADRTMDEGLIIVKSSGHHVCAIEVNCETDFVALTGEFKAIAHRIADQVLADETLINRELVLEVRDASAPQQTIDVTIKGLAGKLGENIQLRHVARFTASHPDLVEGFVHAGAIDGFAPMEGRLGVLIELTVEDMTVVTDTGTLKELAHDLTMHIASNHPIYVTPHDIPEDVMNAKEMEIMTDLQGMDKPEEIKRRILTGRLNKYIQETCLLNQAYIKDEAITVEQLLQQKSQQAGTAIHVKRFMHFSLEQ